MVFRFTLFAGTRKQKSKRQAIAADSWYLLRHFDKASGANPHLTEKGQARASALAELLEDVPITQIYSTHYNRTQQSAAQLAKAKNMAVIEYDPRQLETFCNTLKARPNVVVVGHSNTTPQLLKCLTGKVRPIAESEYGVVFKVVATGNTVTVSEIQL